MIKKLVELLHSIDFLDTTESITGIKDAGISSNPDINSICFDSRNVSNGSLFFALPGTHIHGNTFIPKAIENQAAAIIYQDSLSSEDIIAIKHTINITAFKLISHEDCGYTPPVLIHVQYSRFVMSPISSVFFDNPSSKLAVIGVTGTEGKSSTVSFIWQLLCSIGKKAGFISTVQYSLGGAAIDNPEHQTTPESPIIQERLYQMVQSGCEYAVVESSSHGLSKKTNRLGDVLFDVAVFMNVTEEHLEFHKTYEQYRSDKANLFRALDLHNHNKNINGKLLQIPSFGVINLQDKAASYFAEATHTQTFGFTDEIKSINQSPDLINNTPPITGSNFNNCIQKSISASKISGNQFGVDFSINDKTTPKNYNIKLFIPLPGTFNVYNVMAALITTTHITDTPLPVFIPHAGRLTPIRGRMTEIHGGQPFEVIVDYAHTPSSFETIFSPLKQRAKGRIISLFGSGGERDTIKRPEQGRVAAKYCDFIFLTDEDPRGEDSTALLEMIAKGIPKESANSSGQLWERNKNFFLIPDRPTAIRKAFSIAHPNDIVLLLGKAHENSIIYKDYTMPYNEIAEAEKALAELIMAQS